MGPNVRRLAIWKMSIDAVPAGGGVASAIGFLSDRARLLASARESQEWAAGAIAAVRQAADPNPWRTADDEAIAGEILRAAKERAGRR